MGGDFEIKRRNILCDGQGITNQLNQVFKNPNTPQYQKAQANNTFGDIQNVDGNWKDLIVAYLMAGVDVGKEWPSWCYYLQQLGGGTQGAQSIYDIAQTRDAALKANQGIDTKTHGGGGVRITHGTIDSPCPL